MEVTNRLFTVLVDLYKLTYGKGLGKIDEIYFFENEFRSKIDMNVIYKIEGKLKLMQFEIFFFKDGENNITMKKALDIELEKEDELYKILRTYYGNSFVKYWG